MQGPAAKNADSHVAVLCAVALLCLLLAGCVSEPEPPPATAPATIAAAVPPEPESTAPEPETPAPVGHKATRKAHEMRRSSHRGTRRMARSAPPPPSFHCHIVREADLEGAAGQPPRLDPPPVDLYAKVDPQARTLSVERARDPAFAQTKQHCGDGKASAVAPKKHRKQARRRAKR